MPGGTRSGSAAMRRRRLAACTPVDLLDAADCRRRMAPFREVTHLFYCARAKHGEGGVESVEENVWYGVHLGPRPLGAREDDTRHLPPNFYYDQEDLL